jgi:hypothetical protein
VTSQAAPTRPPQPLEHRMRRNTSPTVCCPPVEARELRRGEGPFGTTLGCQTVDRQMEAGQLMQRTGEDRDPLAAGGGVGSGHDSENIRRTY